MKKCEILIVQILLGLLYFNISAQVNTKEIIRNIKEKLAGEYDKEFLVIIDNPNDDNLLNYFVQDINNLLNDSYVFLASEIHHSENNIPFNLIGIFKNNNIIWHSDMVINGDLVVTETVSRYKDLNSDGKVEIITSWFKNMAGTQEDLWIISWDGNTGEIVNNYDQDGNSKIVTLSNTYELIDIEGDQIFEISSNSIHNIEKVVYVWQNGKIGNLQSIAPSTVPRNLLDIQIRFDILDINNEYYYNYEILNLKSSKQHIENFCIENIQNKITILKKPHGWDGLKITHEKLIRWNTKLFIENNYDYLIKIGDTNNNFLLKGNVLPGITRFYIQGNNGRLNVSIDDIFQNSQSYYTVGPRFNSELNSLIIIDSINSCLFNSFSLNWIKDEQTYIKYSTLLTKAKSNLEQNDSNFSKVYLQKIIKNTFEDSSSVLTSEAFALLYFNTKYLINKLPEINIPDMFDRLIAEIEECKLSGSITNKGIYTSLKKKVENAKKSFEKDNVHSSGQKLKAFQNELRAQKDKHVSIECTETLDEYSEIIIELLEE